MKELENDQKKLFESALLEKLQLSVEARLEAHENARRLVNDLIEAGQEFRAGSVEAS